MATNQIVDELFGVIRIYKDGSIERLKGCEIVPASIDPKTGVQSKDVIISPETGISVRLYIPNNSSPDDHKLPLVVYFHGGAFCIESAFSPTYHNYLNPLVAAANIVAVSVNYRSAPEHLLPTAFEDSWEAVKWVVNAGDEWVKNFADLNRVFFYGDSAGANIAYRMSIRAGTLEGLKLVGNVMVHPYFGGSELIGSEVEIPDVKATIDKLWRLVWPKGTSLDHPMINPNMDGEIGKMGCERLLVCLAEKDWLRERGLNFYEAVKRSGWKGKSEMVEVAGEEHIFHLNNSTSDNALAFTKLLVSFFNQSN